MTEELKGRQRLEVAVNRTSKALNAVVNVFEEFPREFTDEQVQKVFTFLGNAAVAAHQKAMLVRQMSGASFDLDSEVLPAPTTSLLPPDRARIAQPAIPNAIAQTGRKPRPVGRNLETGEVIFSLEEEPTTWKDLPGEQPDPKHGGIADVGFIEE